MSYQNISTRTQIYIIIITALVVIGGIFYTFQGNLMKISNTTSTHTEIRGRTSDGLTLILIKNTETREYGGGHMIDGFDLVVKDEKTKKENLIAKNIWTAQFSPNGKEIITANSSNEIRLYEIDGNEKVKIGKNGSNPIFSHDGKYVAYHKLADEGSDFIDLYEHAKGIALFDIGNGTERMLTDFHGDDSPIGFSSDFNFFYFNAARPYEHSMLGEDVINIESGLYSPNMQTGEVLRLTNADEEIVFKNGPTMSYISPNALWTSNRQTAIGIIEGDGIYTFRFDGKGGLENVTRIGGGSEIRWKEKDKSIEVKVSTGKNSTWSTLNI